MAKKESVKSVVESKNDATKNLSVEEMISAQVAIRSVSKMKFSAKTSFRMALLARAINPYLEEYTKMQNELLDEYGKPDNEGHILISPENRPAFESKLNEIKKTVHAVIVPTFTLAEFDNVDMTPEFYINMSTLIVE